MKYEDIPDPVCGSEDVLVQLKATSINHLDIWVRQGIPGWKVPLPIIPGSDGAGVVVGKGELIKDLAVGDKVLIIPNISCGNCEKCVNGDDNLCPDYGIVGETCNGCDAEMIALPRRNVIPIPKGLNYEEAAAIPLVFMTAWHMLVTKALVKPEQFVLVLAGGSGVGSAAIQIAKLHGARVIATAGSEEKLAKTKELGAEFTINHYKEKISEKVKEVTNVGREPQEFGQLWQNCHMRRHDGRPCVRRSELFISQTPADHRFHHGQPRRALRNSQHVSPKKIKSSDRQRIPSQRSSRSPSLHRKRQSIWKSHFDYLNDVTGFNQSQQ